MEGTLSWLWNACDDIFGGRTDFEPELLEQERHIAVRNVGAGDEIQNFTNWCVWRRRECARAPAPER
jgi:hypothetical protein